MSDEYKRESINKRLAKQYAADALEKERQIRGYDSSTKKFIKEVSELSRYERGKLASAFSTARDYFDKAGDLSFYAKFNGIVQIYNQPSKEVSGKSKSSSEKPSRIEKTVRSTPKQQRALSESKREKSFSELLSDLEKRASDFPNTTWSIMAISTLLTSLFFVSSSLTGFAISNVSPDNTQWIGFCFFACGLVFALLLLKKKFISKHL
jgi:hypothetical protein